MTRSTRSATAQWVDWAPNVKNMNVWPAAARGATTASDANTPATAA